MPDRIPDDWLKTTLGAIGVFSTSSVDKKESSSELSVMLVNYMDVYGHNFIDHNLALMQITATKSEINRFGVRPGDILFTPSSETPDDIGHSAVVVEELPQTLHSYHTVRLRPSGAVPIELRFSGWFANSRAVLEHFARRAAGSTRYTLSLSEFKRTPIALPVELSEQRRIAEILDTLDEAIRRTEQIIAKLKQIKQGLLHDLLTRGIDENGELRDPERHQEQFKGSAVGRVPRTWTVAPLGKQLTLQRGFDITVAQQRPGIIPVVSSSGITSFHDTAMVAGPGVVTGRKGKLGDAFYLEESFWPHDTTLWVKNFHGNNPRFAALFIQHLRLERFDAATSVPTLNRNFIHPMPVALPPTNEQLEIGSIVLSFQERIDAEDRGCEKLRLLKQGLMEDLLTGRVRVTHLEAAA